MAMENQQQQQQHLPDEISIHIISRLPDDSIKQCMLVCKGWLSIIKEDPVFHDMHLRRLFDDDSTASSSLGFVFLETDRYYLFTVHYVRFVEYKHTEHDDDDDDDDDDVVMSYNKRWKLPIKDHSDSVHNNLAIVGSCNGLVCISTTRHEHNKPNHHHQHTFVCNPWTGEVLNLSDSISTDNVILESSSSSSSLILIGIGFGYLPSTNGHKVVRIYGAGDIKNNTQERRRIKHVQVYTLGSSSGDLRRWRTIVPRISWSDISFLSRPRDVSEDSVFKLGVALNGALYFNNYRNIVLFDLANEDFRTIVAPPAPDRDIDGLGVLGGSLCATKSRLNPRSTMINTDLWVMEKDNKKQDQEESFWIKKFSLPPERNHIFSSYAPYGYIPLSALASPPRILLHHTWRRKEQIVFYNPETDDDSYCKDIPIPGDWHRIIRYPIPYMKSCVSLKALGENTENKGNLKCCLTDQREIMEAAGRGWKAAFI